MKFLPVGQGLFATVALDSWGRAKTYFRWVYDCGSDSGKRNLTARIERYATGGGTQSARKRVGLMALSHFDRDHVNGIVELLGRVDVHTLVLPYLTLSQRLMVAVEEDIDPQDPLLGFFLDPVAYIASQERRPRRVLLVPGAGDDDQAPPPPDEDPEGPPPDHDEVSVAWDLDEDPDDPDGLGEPRELVERPPRGVDVKFLRPGGRGRVAGQWEFVPYSDARFAKKATPAFVLTASKLGEALRTARTQSERQDLKTALAKAYDKAFGRERRNDISMFLYGGPLWRALVHIEALSTSGAGELGHWFETGRKDALLYTGDGRLDTHDRLTALIQYLRPDRIRRIACLQVMHHGSKHNSFDGLARVLDPAFSVFCSDPNGKLGHPHAEVLRDFWMHRPVQVDAERAFTARFQPDQRQR